MNSVEYLAFLDGDAIWILIPLTALMIPIVAILIAHQQKMAAIIHGKGVVPNEALLEEIRALRHEVGQLHATVAHQNAGQALAVAPPMQTPPISPPISERLQC